MAKDTQEINRIVYIEPNEFAELAQKADEGVSRDNISWNPEDLQFTVDLQVEKCSRFDESGKGSNTTIKGSWGSFMSGENLNTDTDGAAINSLTDAYTNISYTEYTSTGQSSRELLGIDSIDIDFSSHFYPQVKMRMTDVRGASLFQAAEYNYQIDEWNKAKDKDNSLSDSEKEEQKKPHLGQSFFKSLFHFPYPRFLLTLKGFYGDKVTFVLSVSDFKSAFNSQTGNFDVEISFIGYMYGLYTDIPMNLIFTAPYYNSEYWEQKKKDGTFVYYEDNGQRGKQMLTFPEFVKNYAHLLENIDSSELGERESIITLKKLQDKYNAFIQLQTSFKMAVGFVFEKNCVKEISSNQYRYNAYIFKSKDEISNAFSNSDTVIKTFTEKLNDAKEKYPEYTWLKEFNFPSSISDVSNYKLKNDGNFNQQLITKLVNESELLKRLQTYALENDGQVCLFDKGNFETELENNIKELGAQITSLKEDTDNDVEEAITGALGFKFTVENVYRMIFAHIETFANYFETYVKSIDEKRETQERSAGYLNLDPRHSDLPTGNFSNLTYVPPFPSILDEKRTMIFPGASDNTLLRSMAEVECVENIVKAVTQYADAMGKAIEELNKNVAPTTIEDDTFDLTFDPISAADISYAIKGENPYQFLEKYMSDKAINAKYIMYFIYCRIMSSYGVERINLSGHNDTFKKVCEREINNCINYFEKKGVIFDNSVKQGIITLTKDIVDKDGKVEGSSFKNAFSDFGNTLYPITNDSNEIKNRYTYFTNPFNKKDGENIKSNTATILDLNVSKKALRDFSVKLDEVVITDSNVQTGTYQTFENAYKETDTKYCYTRIRNGESNKYNESSDAKTFLLSNNSTIKTKQSKDVPDKERKNYVNLDITKNDENVENTFNGMQQAYENSGNESLSNYFTGLLTYGEPKGKTPKRKYRHLFLNKLKDGELDADGSLLELLTDENNPNYSRVNDEFLSILYLSSVATYFNDINSSGNKDNKTTIFKYIEHNYKNGRILNLPKPLILYYGALTYFYDYFVDFSTPLEILKGVIDDSLYDLIFNHAEKRHEFIDDYRNLFGYSMINSTNYNQLGYSVENSTLDGLYAYAKKVYDNWYKNEWKTIKTNLCQDKEYYFGEIDKDNNIPLWKHNGKSDKIIKEFLCKDENVLFLNELSELDKNKIALDSKQMKILMSEMNRIFTDYQTLDERNAAEMKEGISSAEHNDIKTGLYYTLKNLYDRWFASQLWRYFELQSPEKDREERNNRNTVEKDKLKSEFNSFLYVNSFYKDISNTFVMNPDIIVNCVKNYSANDKLNKNNSVYEFMAEVAEKNKLLLLALPVYNNFYDLETIKSIFTPNVLYGNKKMQKELGIGNTYLVMYTGEPSSKLGDDQGDYQDDAVDLFGMTEFHGPETYVLFEKDNTTGTIDNNGEKNGEFTVPAFGVTYAKQNQMYFKNIAINMDNPQVTDYSLANLIQISYGGAHGDVNQRFGIGQNIYSIYSNRSYTCTVEMMGCMNIMPSMYFQLNNIPMFRGLYYIIKVSHSIKAGDITTKFMGVRINKNQLAECKFAFDFQTIYDKVLSKTSSDGSGIEGAKQINFSNITVENLIYSDQAVANGINNEPTVEDAEHLRLVADFVNDLAKAWGNGLIVSSGYRSNALNDAVGGSKTSAHSYGYAVDLQAQRASQNVEFRKYVLYFLLTDEKWKNNYDQFIHENKNTSWTHVGLRNSANGTRTEKLYYNSKISKNDYYKLEWDKDINGMITKFYYIKDDKRIPLDN